jgi:hypothetical protein
MYTYKCMDNLMNEHLDEYWDGCTHRQGEFTERRTDRQINIEANIDISASLY